MEEKTKVYTIKASKEMMDLITEVREEFTKKYGFRPSIPAITKLITQRVRENNLF